MSGLLKLDNPVATSRVRDLRLAEPPSPPERSTLDPELEALRLQVGDLRRDVELKALEIDHLTAVAHTASQKGFAEGFATGKLEGQERREQSLQVLKAGVERAEASLAAALEGLERLAVQIAQQALAKMVDDTNQRRDLLADIVRKQTKNIETASILYIYVSSTEFPDAESLRSIRAAAGHSELNIEPNANLSPGDCVIKLVLGELEVGINQQWGRISTTLKALSEPGETL